MKWLWVTLGMIAVIVVAALVFGWLLPEAHRASRQATFQAPPDKVWALITGVEAFPAWRTDVTTVQRLPDRDGRPVWIEEGRNGRLTLAVERSDPPRLLVTRIADPELPFGGTWTYEISPAPGGSTLTITEDGVIYNPFFRVMARFVFGHESTLAAYLSAADARLASAR
jgi:uncharacterized protein YndB with AHSA1/START domain